MKLEVNCDWGESKTKQSLYRQVTQCDLSLELRQFEVLEKPNLRIYCQLCWLDITRIAYVISKEAYYCIGCFSSLQVFPFEYYVRHSMNQSFTKTNWTIMDEVIMITALKLWGFGNWGQIKDYMDYNGSPFSLKQIQQHFEQYYLGEPNKLIIIPQVLYKPCQRRKYGEICIEGYKDMMESKTEQLKRKDSKGEKKPLLSSMRSLSALPSSKDILQQKQNLPKNGNACQQVADFERDSCRIVKKDTSHIQSNILGYNPKRKQFQLGEYDYMAEGILADLQFYDNDEPQQFKLKLQIIQHYNRRLQERINRRQFVVEYKLLDSHYNFGSQQKISRQINELWKPFMKFTKHHQEYTELLQNYSLNKKYERYIANLTKIRHKVSKEGTINCSFEYMQQKRQEYIKNWQKNFKKDYKDNRRKIYTFQSQEKPHQGNIGQKDWFELEQNQVGRKTHHKILALFPKQTKTKITNLQELMSSSKQSSLL